MRYPFSVYYDLMSSKALAADGVGTIPLSEFKAYADMYDLSKTYARNLWERVHLIDVSDAYLRRKHKEETTNK